MKILSVNLGASVVYEWQGRSYRTAIAKAPTSRPVRVTSLGLEGDRQANLQVHGGPDKAVYGYAHEHYAAWDRILAEHPVEDAAALALPLQPSAFGENLTTEGLLEADLAIGDRLRVGTALLVVSQPRLPCQNLALLHRRPQMVKLFAERAWPGIYFRVEEEGLVTAGDPIEIVTRAEPRVTPAEMARAYLDGGPPELLERALAAPGLTSSWREHFEAKLRGGPR